MTTKATQLEAALPSAPAALVEGTAVPLLNGVDHVARLREVYRSVTPGTIRVETERREPGHIVQLLPFIGVELAGPLAAEIAAELNAAGIDARVAEDELTMLWSKLVMLAPLALTTAATMRPLGGVRDDPRWRERLLEVMAEAVEVARGLGARIDPEVTRGMLLAAPDSMRSSMQKDRELGRPLEVDAIAGPDRAGRSRAGGADAPDGDPDVGPWLGRSSSAAPRTAGSGGRCASSPTPTTSSSTAPGRFSS